MEEAALSNSFHADAAVCGEALLATLEKLQGRGILTQQEAESVLKDYSEIYPEVLHECLESEQTETLRVDVRIIGLLLTHPLRT